MDRAVDKLSIDVFSGSLFVRYCVILLQKITPTTSSEKAIEIDLVVKKTKQNTGLSRHSNNLKKELAKRIKVNEIDTSESIPRMLLFIGKFLPFDLKTVLSNNPLFLPINEGRIIHFTEQNFVLPLFFHRGKSVVTIHDLMFFEESRKELFIGKEQSLFSKILARLLLRAIKKADWIITVSDYTKKRLVSMTGYPKERITILKEGVDRSEFRPLNVEKDPFTVLYVGSEMPRKNLPVLFEAFVLVKKKFPAAKLIKIGVPQWPGSRKRLEEMAERLGIIDSVIFKDYVGNLAREYNKATVFVHPSIYEGFGFPVVEAMACGCPVICSNKTSLPEVGGDSVVYFNPSNPEELAERIELIFKDKGLREDLARKGLKRAELFRWDVYAEKVIEIYKRL